MAEKHQDSLYILMQIFFHTLNIYEVVSNASFTENRPIVMNGLNLVLAIYFNQPTLSSTNTGKIYSVPGISFVLNYVVYLDFLHPWVLVLVLITLIC